MDSDKAFSKKDRLLNETANMRVNVPCLRYWYNIAKQIYACVLTHPKLRMCLTLITPPPPPTHTRFSKSASAGKISAHI